MYSDEQINSILREIKDSSSKFIALCSQDFRNNRGRCELIEYMAFKGLLVKSDSQVVYKISVIGQEVLFIGSYSEWKKQQTPEITPSIQINNAISGQNVINGSSFGVISEKNEIVTANKSGTIDKIIEQFITPLTVTIIGGIIVGLILILILKK